MEGDDSATTLLDLLTRWSHAAVEVCAVLPAPATGWGARGGERGRDRRRGVPAGAVGRGAWALVPDVTEFGSVYETGHLVTWRVTPVPSWRTRVLAAVGPLADAERDLRVALLTATEALASLDVARWREDAAETIASLRSTTPGLAAARGPPRTTRAASACSPRPRACGPSWTSPRPTTAARSTSGRPTSARPRCERSTGPRAAR
ncbi:hypothetical protein NKG05_29885 [Oerskovia sp. M15]